MNNFATIFELASFRKVKYYTIKLENDMEDLFEQFLRNSSNFKEELEEIRSWIEKIGDDYGAKERWFRFEAARGGSASALPPKAKYLVLNNHLRLYCMRIDNANVILFSGAQKTALKSQDCEQVKPHFLLANKLSKAIHTAIVEKLIVITDNGLDFSNNFELEY